jgi:hypothetical protein
MRWYIRDLDGGTVWGPYTKEEAEIQASHLDDVVMFSERIFEPQFVTSLEVGVLIEDMKTIETATDVWSGKSEQQEVDITPFYLMGVAKRARNALVLLSAKKLVTGTIDGGVLDIDEVPAGVEVKINDYDCQDVDEDRLSEDEDGRHFVSLEFGG